MRGFVCGVVTGMACVGVARAAEPADEVKALVASFVMAQAKFDVPQITALTAEDYVEISPLGEVDPREKMLGYYAPEHKVDSPPFTLTETEVRVHGDTGIDVAKLTWEMKGADGQPHRMALRVVFVAHRVGDAWKLESAQYTGIRAKK